MGFRDLLRWLFGAGDERSDSTPARFDLAELARRLDIPVEELRSVDRSYHEFTVPKRSGGLRELSAPNAALKNQQRRIHKRLLARLRSHPGAAGFEPGQSIVTHARRHAGKAVVVTLDIKDFFPSTTAERVRDFFRLIGWDEQASTLLTDLCTRQGALPQGAPTSPRLSNLVNYGMDRSLDGLAFRCGADYSRYADDLAFSFSHDDSNLVRAVLTVTERTVGDFGYAVHHQKKLRIRREHQQQMVTGLVVNDRAALPRRTRRWLRAVEHRVRVRENPVASAGRPMPAPTLTPNQLAGWRALRSMVANQSAVDSDERQAPSTAIPSARSDSAKLVSRLAEATGLSTAPVTALLDELASQMVIALGRHGAGSYVIPGLVKLRTLAARPQAARWARNRGTGFPIRVPATPTRKTVKVRALAPLKKAIKKQGDRDRPGHKAWAMTRDPSRLGLSRREVLKAFDALTDMIIADVRDSKGRKFTLPGLLEIRRSTSTRRWRDPRTGQRIPFDPDNIHIRARAHKELLEAIDFG